MPQTDNVTVSEPREMFQQIEPLCSRWAYFWMAAAIISGIFGLLQTRAFVKCLDYPTPEVVRKNMENDERMQQTRAAQYYLMEGKPPQDGIIFHPTLFTDNETKMLRRVLRRLMEDEDVLQKQIRKDFGRSLHDVKAFVFPAWKAHYDRTEFGLTEFGMDAARLYARDPNVGGYTVLDQYDINRHVCVDGAGRIGLNQQSFENDETLLITLFHELLHAMNVRKYEPPKYITYLQNDLAYSDQYRNYIRLLRVTENSERNIWIGAALPWLCFVFAVVRHVRCRRRQRRPSYPSSS